ncbi:DUF4173 domain-containing protein [uncultured Psychroserpens sp.]|uniref:DUF4153 domain-containing protein n=1 Tax=uncultured Psychroserpens sp. TaxID=255436 RepID=UPI0026029C2A|nr:DUF4173 domain-containing protein [uncultured Psychroserpens sp.]
MKQISTLIASLTFSILFFEKSIGLNLSIFTVLTIILLAIYNPSTFKSRITLLHALAYLITAVVVFVNHSVLSILTNCAAFLSLVGSVSKSNTSVYIRWLNGTYTTIASFFHRNFQVDNHEKVNWKKDIDVMHWAKLIGIPLIFIITFVLLYKNGNPLFNDLVSKIHLNFINLQWLLFSALGYYLFNNITKPVQVEPATSLDLKTTNTLLKSEKISEEKLKKEKQLGTTLLALLNVLIVLYIITDVIYITSTNTVSAPDLSNQVHSGINTLIASIIIAIIIILYFFRGHLNFYSKNRTLKNLTYLWIILNIVLVVLIVLKNHNYITSFGLTYKRIGVHVFIILTLFGLLTTYLKVLHIKNLTFLFRINAQVAFIVLITLSVINWDSTITTYNLEQARSFDIDYLIDLSDRNAVILHEKKNTIRISQTEKNRIETKYTNYVNNLMQLDWQEFYYELYTMKIKK